MTNLPSKLQLVAPRIKVCGVTCAEDLEWMASKGVDTVGLNLVPTSRRCVSLDQAVELAIQARELNLRVAAVLMDPTADWLTRVSQATAWDFIQLHGSERPELVEPRLGPSIIKAISWTGRGSESELVAAWKTWAVAASNDGHDPSHSSLAGFLVDAYSPVQGGGTGQTVDWSLLASRPPEFGGFPMLLAGGLNPDNVGTAIQATGCQGVDVASGVEASPGRKSRELVRQFVRQALLGFSRNEGRRPEI